MLPRRFIVVIFAVLIALANLSARPFQQEGSFRYQEGSPTLQEGGQFFEETGYWVRGEFWDLYRAAPDAGRLLGLPISDALPDPLRPGITVQYFERARMDYDPAQPAGERVTLAALGASLLDENRRVEPLSFSTNTNMCRAFSGGHAVCFAFLQFYDGFEGARFLGQPITGTEVMDGQVVQVFELGRLEWHPDRPAGQRVVVSELGRLDYLLRMGAGPIGSAIPSSRPLNITAHAFLERAVAAAGQRQQVTVLVVDQSGAPVPDVDVLISVRYPDGRESKVRPGKLTDASGVTSVAFDVEGVTPNDVVMVTAAAQVPGGPSTSASTSFRIWW